jgi:hypothetical protein
MQLRYTPSDDRCFASTAFWKTKWEVGAAAGFGFGDRPTYKKDDSVAPNAYGDVSKQVGNTKNQVLRANITMHPKFPSMEERYRDLSWPKCGPGPGKYDTRIPAGQGSWFNPTPNPSWSMQSRPIIDGELREALGKPGPGFDTRVDPGKNSPVKKGTLYDIKVKGRHPPNDIPGAISPGPARYNHKEGFDSKGLLEKILNVPIPPSRHTRKTSMPRPDGDEEGLDELEGEDYEGLRSTERGRSGASSKGRHKGSRHGASSKRKLPRVESSPAVLA